MEKACRSCGLIKSISEFYKHSGMKEGHLHKCKDCQKKNTSDARLRRPEYYKEYDALRANLPHRINARNEYSKSDAGKLAHKKALAKQIELHPKKATARYATSNAIRDGRLLKQPCFICGKAVVEAHHPDYDNPLGVTWLCNLHHRQAHALARTI